MRNPFYGKLVSGAIVDPLPFQVLSVQTLDKALYKLPSLPEKLKRIFLVGKSDFPGEFREVLLKNIPQHVSVLVSEFDLGHLSHPLFIPSNINIRCKSFQGKLRRWDNNLHSRTLMSSGVSRITELVPRADRANCQPIARKQVLAIPLKRGIELQKAEERRDS
jgi:hypothetical protein